MHYDSKTESPKSAGLPVIGLLADPFHALLPDLL